MKSIKRILALIVVAAATFAAAAQDATPSNESNRRKASFAWGANLGGNVDLSSHDMSAIGISAEFGFRWNWIRFIGVGAEGDIMVGNSNRTFPIFVNFRTDFSSHRRLLFMDLRGGMALNYFYNDSQKTGAYVSGGVGITLAEGKSFSSHIILAYTYIGNEICYNGDYVRNCPGISMATLRLGVAF